MQQQIRFCSSFDGTRIAYAATGEGPPLVKAPHWLTHLEYEQQSAVWRPWLAALSRGRTLLRMDERGCGLADRGVPDISFEAFVRDLEAVVDAAGLERFALFGHSQGGAISIEYAARHPERVTHLVLLGAYARGRFKREPERREEFEAQLKLVEVGWGRDDASYRQLFASQFMPGATLDQMRLLCELQRVSSHASDAVRLMRAAHEIDVQRLAAARRVPDAGAARARRPARLVRGRATRSRRAFPDARFVLLESDNHILLEHEPAFARAVPGAGGVPPWRARRASTA